jgi:hypothetical protein
MKKNKIEVTYTFSSCKCTKINMQRKRRQAGEGEEDEFEEDYTVSSSSLLLERQASTPPQQQPATATASSSSLPPVIPESASTPITNHFDSVLECLDFLRNAEQNDHIDKQEIIDTMKARLHNMISKILLNNTITSMSMMGWRLE